MRTIKRKRIFGGRKSIHKKKHHKRSFKKFRGGVELNYLTSLQEIYKVKGILGHQKPGPLYKYDTTGVIKDISLPNEHNLFKGNIKHDNGAVILTDYKPLKSIKIGWIYGGHFGNIVIYSSANQLAQVINKINTLLFKQNVEIVKTLFVREIDEEVIKFCENTETLKKEISPWESMTQEFDFKDSDLDDGSIDTMFKSILAKYYEEKINGISKNKIEVLLDSVVITNLQMDEVRKSNSLDKYKNILQRRNKSFVKQFIVDCISDKIPTNEKWDDKIPAADASKPIDDPTNYPDIYKKINALRLKQEMIYKESTDIFSIYISTHNKEIIPFNIEYFLYDVNPNPKSNELIYRVIKKFNQKTPLFNNRCYKCISKIMYILQIFNPNNVIYRNSNDIVRYKQITDTDFKKGPEKKDVFLVDPHRDNPLIGFRGFLNAYVINSLIDPVIMARLLSFNIQIKATILLSCINDTTKQTNYPGGQKFNDITNLDINHTSVLYKSIDDDDLRLKIKRLKINDKEITDDDLVQAKKPAGNQSKVTGFAKVFDGDSDIVKSIECDLEVPPFALPKGEEPIIKLNCKCKMYKKETGNITDIMIYLFDKDEQSNFNQTLISMLLDKKNQIDNIYNIDDKYLDLFDKHLLGNESGHVHVYYDLIL